MVDIIWRGRKRNRRISEEPSDIIIKNMILKIDALWDTPKKGDT